MNYRSLISLPLVFLLTLPAIASDSDLQQRFQGTIDDFLVANPEVPGVVVHFICPTQELDWTAVAGTSEVDNPDRILGPGQTFRIASNTKTYVAASVMRLVELGKLDLDDSLADRLSPIYCEKLYADGYDLKSMTISQLLSHTSGMFEHPADPRYAEAIMANPQRVWTRDEQLDLCLEWGDPVGKPGELFKYSDTGYLLLGSIVEDITGQSLGRAVHSLLDYEKLGLDATWWEIDEKQPSTSGPRAHQYYFKHDTTDWDCSLDLFGGGGLLTDAYDLAWFLRKLVMGEVLAEPSSTTAMMERGTLPYRLGIMRVEMGERLAWGHTGFWNTFAFHLPELDLTIAGSILNYDSERGQDLADKLVSDYLKSE